MTICICLSFCLLFSVSRDNGEACWGSLVYLSWWQSVLPKSWHNFTGAVFPRIDHYNNLSPNTHTHSMSAAPIINQHHHTSSSTTHTACQLHQSSTNITTHQVQQLTQVLSNQSFTVARAHPGNNVLLHRRDNELTLLQFILLLMTHLFAKGHST